MSGRKKAEKPVPELEEGFEPGDNVGPEQEAEDYSMAEFMDLPWGDRFE